MKNHEEWIWTLAYLLSTLGSVRGFSAATFNSNSEACNNLNPSGHGAAAQTSASPYVLEVSGPTFTASSSLTLTIKRRDSSDPHFKGFLVQARRVDNSAVVGSFTVVTDTKINCVGLSLGGDTLTHTDASPKDTISVTWTAPSAAVGDVQFRAVVVQTMTTFWRNIESTVITGAAAVPTMSPTPTPTPAPPPGSTVPKIDVGACGSSKACFRIPDKCTDNCDFLVTWQKSGADQVDIEIQGTLSGGLSAGQSYVALGFSKDTKMGDDSVIDCISSGSTVIIQQSYNDGKSNILFDGALRNLVRGSLSGGVTDGALVCRLTRQITLLPRGSEGGKIFDLTNSYHLLLAKGATSGNIKTHHSVREWSQAMININNVTEVGSGSSSGYPLVAVHGILMVLAWMVSASSAILLPRYFKDAWPDKKLGGKAIWFQFHQPMMIITAILTGIAFIVIFVEVQGYAEYPNLPQKAHPPLGIVTTILVFLNPIMAAFRPDPGSPKRSIFNWAHWFVGECAHACAVATIFLALALPKAAIPSWGFPVMIVFIVFHILIEIILTIHKCCTQRRNQGDDIPMNSMNVQERQTQRNNKPSMFKTATIVLHFFGVLALAIAMIVPIASA